MEHLAPTTDLDQRRLAVRRLGVVAYAAAWELQRELAARGVKRLAVFCPAFVADCLETLEEIGIRAREQFRARGGDDLFLVPSLNSSPAWVDVVVDLARRHAHVES